MTDRHHLLYSLDYEVFWSENDDEIGVLIKPTDHLLTLAERLGFRFTLFVDVLSLRRYAEIGKTAFVEAAEEQLRRAVERGHDVQVHLHPHWLSATRVGERWRFSGDRFLLGAPGGDEGVFELSVRLLREARSYLEGLLRPSDPAYSVVAFRAGGYGLQPGEHEILRALIEAGYAIDSSVVPGMHLQTGRNRIDFRHVPDAGNYFLDETRGLTAPAPTGVLEVPIAAGPVSVSAMAMRLARYVQQRSTVAVPLYGRGHSHDADAGQAAESGTVVQSLIRKVGVIARRSAMLRLPEDPLVLLALTRSWIARHGGGGPLYFSLLMHPKGLTTRMVADLERYHALAMKTTRPALDCITFQQAAARLGLSGHREASNADVPAC